MRRGAGRAAGGGAHGARTLTQHQLRHRAAGDGRQQRRVRAGSTTQAHPSGTDRPGIVSTLGLRPAWQRSAARRVCIAHMAHPAVGDNSLATPGASSCSAAAAASCLACLRVREAGSLLISEEVVEPPPAVSRAISSPTCDDDSQSYLYDSQSRWAHHDQAPVGLSSASSDRDSARVCVLPGMLVTAQ